MLQPHGSSVSGVQGEHVSYEKLSVAVRRTLASSSEYANAPNESTLSWKPLKTVSTFSGPCAASSWLIASAIGCTR